MTTCGRRHVEHLPRSARRALASAPSNLVDYFWRFWRFASFRLVAPWGSLVRFLLGLWVGWRCVFLACFLRFACRPKLEKPGEPANPGPLRLARIPSRVSCWESLGGRAQCKGGGVTGGFVTLSKETGIMMAVRFLATGKWFEGFLCFATFVQVGSRLHLGSVEPLYSRVSLTKNPFANQHLGNGCSHTSKKAVKDKKQDTIQGNTQLITLRLLSPFFRFFCPCYFPRFFKSDSLLFYYLPCLGGSPNPGIFRIVKPTLLIPCHSLRPLTILGGFVFFLGGFFVYLSVFPLILLQGCRDSVDSVGKTGQCKPGMENKIQRQYVSLRLSLRARDI